MARDLLLLDEPTNHLDVDAKTWLMKFLASYRGALMVVSHDIGLLDASITRILHLDVEGVVEYQGTYTQYRNARAVDEQRLTKLAARQTAEIKRLKTLADSHARADGQARAQGEVARHARREAGIGEGRRTGAREARAASGSPSRRTAAATSWSSRTWRSAMAGRRCSPTSRSTSDAASAC